MNFVLKTAKTVGKSALLLGLAASVSAPTYAISLGGSKSGNKFDYAACSKIVEGKTKADTLDALLGAEPVTTGKSGGLFYKSYQYNKSGGLGGIGAFGVSLGGSKGKQFRCTVNYNSSGTVVNVDMQEVEMGSSGAGI
ncbi:MAG: hypothetical protein AB8C02_04445 [Halioglobus sp.]